MRWAGHVAHMGKRRGAYRILVGDLRKGDHLEDPGLDGGILKWIFKKWCEGALTRLIWLMMGTGQRF